MFDYINPAGALTGSHLRTYQTIFQHPVSHNLGWLDVHAMFRQLGQVDEEPNGNVKVTRNGHVLVLPPPRMKDVGDTDEVVKIRNFIERSAKAEAKEAAPAERWVVALSHREARIFRSDSHGTASEKILPPEPEDFFRHAPNSKDFARGKEKPNPNSFFEPIAQALKPASEILICGSGTGAASEKDQFLVWLKTHHPDLARRIAGSMTIDAHHLTDAQLLEKARNYQVA